MLSYEQALKTIFGRMDMERGARPPYAERVWRLARMAELLHAMDDPQQRYPSIHVAGTKGKGSTTAMIASALKAGGLRVGMYTSPHLHTFRERIQVDGEPISEAELCRLVERLQPVLAERPEVTVFEIMTALAMMYFGTVGVDWAVFEVGMGGRLDATNVIQPQVAVITSISLDHVAVLGNTLALIAREKAGIIKEGVPVVSAPQDPEALAVITGVAAEHHAPLLVGGRDWLWHPTEEGPSGAGIDVYRQGYDRPIYHGLAVPLIGDHQRDNAVNAIMALEVLRQQGLALSRETIAAGIAKARWPARFEILQDSPRFVVDGAHNVDSMQKLLRTIESRYPGQRPTVIFGAGRGHLPADLLRVLQGHVERLCLVRADHPKATEVSELAFAAQALGLAVDACSPAVDEAVAQALWTARPDELVVATGSLFVAAEARAAWMHLRGLPPPPSDPPGIY